MSESVELNPHAPGRVKRIFTKIRKKTAYHKVQGKDEDEEEEDENEDHMHGSPIPAELDPDIETSSSPLTPVPTAASANASSSFTVDVKSPNMSDGFDETELMTAIQPTSLYNGTSINNDDPPTKDSSSSSSPSSSTGACSQLTAWFALLTALFSLAAVGPMFLWLEKQHVSPILAIVWRQITQTLCLIIPCVIEYYRTPVATRKWWKMKVRSITAEDDEEEEKNEGANQSLEEEQSHLPPSGVSTSSSATPSSASQIEMTEIRTNDNDSADVDANIDSPDDNLVDPSHPSSSSAAQSSSSSFFSSFTSNPFVQMYIITIYWSISVSVWVVALPFTSAARASLFASLTPLFIIGWLKFYHGVKVSLGEFVGVCVCLIGISTSEIMSSLHPDTNTLIAQENSLKVTTSGLNSTDSAAGVGVDEIIKTRTIFPVENMSPSETQFLGDVLCIASGAFIAMNVLTAAPTRKVVPLFGYSFWTSLMVLFNLLIMTLALEGSTFGMDPHTGVMGWLTSTEMIIRVILFGFIVGMVGILGFNYSVSHLNPIVFSTVQLLDPGISGVMSAVFGVEGWPVLSTYIGVTIVTGGIFLVVYHQAKREGREAEEKNKKKKQKQIQSTRHCHKNTNNIHEIEQSWHD